MKRLIGSGAIVYLIALVAYWATLYYTGDRWWLATALLFAPRWVAALPLVVMLPMSLTLRPLIAPAFTLHAGIILIPIMGFQIPVPQAEPNDSCHLRVLTYNVGGGGIYPEALIELVRTSRADVVLLQECESAFAEQVFRELGWNCRREALLAIGSRYPLGEAEVLARHEPQQHLAVAIICPITMPDGRLSRVVSVHLPTPRPGLTALWEEGIQGSHQLTELLDYRERISCNLAKILRSYSEPMVIAGDFNMPVESAVYRESWSEYQNAFSCRGLGWGYTKQTRWHGIRIDHVLLDYRWNVCSAEVQEPLGGDHCPLLTEVAWSH